MTKKPLLFAAAAIFSAVGFAAPKAYTVMISTPLQIGATQLTPGKYRMALEGNKAVFTLSHHTAVAVPVKVETAAHKYPDTVVDTVDQRGSRHLRFIELGGSTNKIEFDQ